MEQNNLVVTPDGKTWDEVTRDTSYIGDIVLSAITDTNFSVDDVIFDEWWGDSGNSRVFFNKDSFVIGYDQTICLKDGCYEIMGQTRGSVGGEDFLTIKINTSNTPVYGTCSKVSEHGDTSTSPSYVLYLKRGDYIRIVADWGHHADLANYKYQIKKV